MSLPTRKDGAPDVAGLISDPLQCGTEEAVARLRKAIADGELTDLRLGDLLSEELGTGGNAARLLRLLEIIEALDCGQHILKARPVLLAHPDLHVRSKATLIIARASRNADWILRQLLEPDARVQANAVEAVWGIDTPEIRKVFSAAARSPHNRVAMNALVGLYRQGDVTSIARILAAAEHEYSEPFRASARWAMGETGDPRFLPYLNSAFRTDPPKRRAVAIRALARIRRNLGPYEQAERVRPEVLSAVAETAGSRRVELSLHRNGDWEHTLFAPADFVITEDDCLVTRYSVNARTDPEVLVIGFAIPRIPLRSDPYSMAIESGLRACLEWKRKTDLWCIDRYSCDDEHEPDESADLAAMRSEDPQVAQHLRRYRGFLTAADIIEKVIPGPGRKEQASRDALAGSAKAIEILARAAGERHLFLCLHADAPLTPRKAEDLERRASEEKIVLHGILPNGPEDATELVRICRESGGTFSRIPEDQIAFAMAAIFRGFLKRYEIVWWPPDATGAARCVRLQIFSLGGCADCTIDLEQTAP
jgi:HEAT repeat protein